jgi:hypothetical protein
MKCNFCDAKALYGIIFQDEKDNHIPVCFECTQKFMKANFQPQVIVEIPSGFYDQRSEQSEQ